MHIIVISIENFQGCVYSASARGLMCQEVNSVYNVFLSLFTREHTSLA